MSKIILKDKTEYQILDGTTLDNIKIIVTDFNDIKLINEIFVKSNLESVNFVDSDDNIFGKYENLVLVSISYLPNEDNTEYTVTISLRESTELEQRINALEEGHISNADVIDSILTDIIPNM